MARWSDTDFEDGLTAAQAASAAEAGTEAALVPLTGLAHAGLGDPEAARRTGALLPGERDYRVAGVFVITPDRSYNMLVANQGFPPEQRRLAIPLDWNHPGEVVRTQMPILLENTDEHGAFRQFLKTSKMGSSMYHPIIVSGRMVAQIVAAAQARWTYDAGDMARLARLAEAAAGVWQATDGNIWLGRDYPAADIWRAEEKL